MNTGEGSITDKFDPIAYNELKVKLARIKNDERALQGTGSGIGGRMNANGTEEEGIYAGSGKYDYDIDPATRIREGIAFNRFLYNAGEAIGAYFSWDKPFYVNPNEHDLLGAKNVWLELLGLESEDDPAYSDSAEKRKAAGEILDATRQPGVRITEEGKVVDAKGQPVLGPNGVQLEAIHIDAAETELGVCSANTLPDQYYDAKQTQYDRVRRQVMERPHTVEIEELPTELRLRFEGLVSDGENLSSVNVELRMEILEEYDALYVTGQRVENDLMKEGIGSYEELEALIPLSELENLEANGSIRPPFSVATSPVIPKNKSADAEQSVPAHRAEPSIDHSLTRH